MVDVDFETMQCTVLGKGNKERIVYLSEVAMMHLKEYISSRKDFTDALFVGKGGKSLSKNGIEACLRRLGKKAGVVYCYISQKNVENAYRKFVA